jgi:hypothetical protein
MPQLFHNFIRIACCQNYLVGKVGEFQLASLAAAIIIIYAFMLTTAFSMDLLVATAPIALVCLMFVGYVGFISSLFGSVAWGVILGYFSLGMWSFMPPGLGPVVAVVIAVPCLIYLLSLFWRIRRRVFLAASLGLLSALTVFATRRGYTWINIMDRVHAGEVHQDTLFHAAIAAMVKTYGVASTGLNGLVEINYHVFSHRMFATLSEISGAPILMVYGLAPWILFAPLLIFSLTYAATHVGGLRNFWTTSFSWTAFCVLLIALPYFFKSWCLWDSYFVSESYLVALSLLCAALPALVKRSSSSKEIVFAGLICALAAMCKGSVGLLLSFLFLLKALFYAEDKIWSWLAASIAGAAMVLASLGTAGAARSYISVEPLHFIWTRTGLGKSLSAAGTEVFAPSMLAFWQGLWMTIGFICIHFIMSWLVIFALLRVSNARWIHCPSFVLNVGALVFSAGPVLMLNMPAGAVYYFSSCALFVAMPFVGSMAAEWLGGRIDSRGTRWIPVAGLILIGLMGHGTITRKYTKHRQVQDLPANPAVTKLEQLRTTPGGGQQLYAPSRMMLLLNPLQTMSARPFLYPAVSERAWTGILESSPEVVQKYQYYGYPDYLTPDGSALRDDGELQSSLMVEIVDITDTNL